MELHLIRHTSVAVPLGTCYGQTDVPLADTFTVEAALVHRSIKHHHYDKVYCSPLSRCTRLANFCGHPSPTIDSRLMEMNFGSWENQRWDEITDPHLTRWFESWISQRTTNGESFNDLCERSTSFIESIRNSEEQKIAIFTHAGFIRATWVTTQQYTPQEAFNRKIAYGEVVVVRI